MTTTASIPARTHSPAFGKFALVFGIAFVITYVVCDVMSWPLFTYFPATGNLAWGRQPAIPSGGPAMYWYGWTANCFIVSIIAGLLATLLPDNVAKRIPLWLTWLLPVLAIPLLLYTLMPLLNHR
jgi:uncharacterized membrane protein